MTELSLLKSWLRAFASALDKRWPGTAAMIEAELRRIEGGIERKGGTVSEQIEKFHIKRLIRRRCDTTLARWWHTLNIWGWPKEIPGPDSEARRMLAMEVIEMELGSRRIKELNWGAPGGRAG